MATIHYLNVKNGDCSIIEHYDGKISVIDVNNAKEPRGIAARVSEDTVKATRANQKDYPVNPIEYMNDRGMADVFRFILTHPDMDHMDGVKHFFETFFPTNFWDSDNTKEDMSFSGSPYKEEDWVFYKSLRDGNRTSSPKRLTLYSGSTGPYFNRNADGKGGGNGLHILAPTPDLLKEANDSQFFNDASYVILYKSHDKRILFGGDADNNTWDYVLKNHPADVKNVDLLIAPHHGRKSSCSYEFLRAVNPKFTFFGNADKASHLAHTMFNNLGLEKITNNEGDCLIADIDSDGLHIYVTCKAFAESKNPGRATYNPRLKAYLFKTI